MLPKDHNRHILRLGQNAHLPSRQLVVRRNNSRSPRLPLNPIPLSDLQLILDRRQQTARPSPGRQNDLVSNQLRPILKPHTLHAPIVLQNQLLHTPNNPLNPLPLSDLHEIRRSLRCLNPSRLSIEISPLKTPKLTPL